MAQDKYDGHTPGPWTIDHEPMDVEKGFVAINAVNDDACWYAFATVCTKITQGGDAKTLYPDPQGEANARLIAAAPDLLAENRRLREALRNLLEEADFRKIGERNELGYSTDTWGEVQARAALAEEVQS